MKKLLSWRFKQFLSAVTCTRYQQAICQQTVLRFYVSLRGTFSNSKSSTLINKYLKGAVVQISVVFGAAYNVSSRRVFSHRTFQKFIKPRLLQSLISEIHKLWGSPFFSKCSKLNLDFKTGEVILKKVFVFWIIASELIALNCSY